MKALTFAAVLIASMPVVPAQTSPGGSAPPQNTMSPRQEKTKALLACARMVAEDLHSLHIPDDRATRFQDKVSEAKALCRGGEKTLQFRGTPWVDWGNYWGTGDVASLPSGFISNKIPADRGVAGALIDLELQRIALIKLNLFDNTGTYADYVRGRDGSSGPSIKVWPQMRLDSSNPLFKEVGGDGTQICQGNMIRWRTVNGVCNDILNPAMGSAGMLFARNVEFETSFPDMGLNELTRNRHGNRLSLLGPDPQLISRRLFTRIQSAPDKCQNGYGLPGDAREANCDYTKRRSSMCSRPIGSSS